LNFRLYLPETIISPRGVGISVFSLSGGDSGESLEKAAGKYV